MPGCCGRKRRWFGDATGSDYHQRGIMNRGAGRGQGRSGRGPGRGQGQIHRRPGPVRGLFETGETGFCLCPQCGRREPHEPGVPCVKRFCPNCGIAMMRRQ
ncbi:MAG: hypothetical protein WDA74_00915 [Spirochaetota bacterium]|jgi:hypothetical protein